MAITCLFCRFRKSPKQENSASTNSSLGGSDIFVNLDNRREDTRMEVWQDSWTGSDSRNDLVSSSNNLGISGHFDLNSGLTGRGGKEFLQGLINYIRDRVNAGQLIKNVVTSTEDNGMFWMWECGVGDIVGWWHRRIDRSSMRCFYVPVWRIFLWMCIRTHPLWLTISLSSHSIMNSATRSLFGNFSRRASRICSHRIVTSPIAISWSFPIDSVSQSLRVRWVTSSSLQWSSRSSPFPILFSRCSRRIENSWEFSWSETRRSSFLWFLLEVEHSHSSPWSIPIRQDREILPGLF